MTFSARRIRYALSVLLVTMTVILTCITSLWAEPVNKRTIPISTVAVIHCEYNPVSFWNRTTNTPSGFFVDIMDSVASRAGLQVSYICKNSWGEVIAAIESGEADFGVLLKSKEREKKLLFSDPIDTTYLSFFARSQSDVDPARVPSDHVVGVVKGSMSLEQLKDRDDVKLQIYGGYREGLFGLLAGEISLFAGEDSMVLKQMRETRLEDRIKKVGKPFVERQRCLVVRKDNVQLVELMNKTLRDFMSGPEYQQIYLKWYGQPTPYWTNRKVLTACGVFLIIALSGIALWRYVSIFRLNKELIRTISDRKRAEAEREQFYKFFQTSSDLMVIADPNGAFMKTNPACTETLGYFETELVAKPFIEFVHPEDKQATLDEMASQLQRGFSLNFENRYICKDGSVRWLSWRAIFNKDEGITYATARDITERKQAEEKIRQSEQFIRNMLDTVDEGFIVIDRDYRILTANKAYCSQVGGCDEKIIGSHCYEISHKINRPCYDEGEECAVRHVFETGKPHAALHRHKDAKGNILYVETKAYPIKDASGAVTSVIETINNITEKHLLEEERLKTQKLESIGTLAGGIAHDFNNLLQGVFGYISMARMTIDQKEKSLSMLYQAEEALHLSVNLATQLLTFSKGGKPVKKLIRIRPAVENAVKFALSGSHTNYEIDMPADLWSVDADEGQLAQVIQNIVLNANEAMAGSGTVRVSLANVDITKDTIAGLPDGGQFVRIAIQDSGIGIPEHNLAKIFDPYFTTKQKGSGLGLATSYSIIINHGGVIEVASALNRGTTFAIYLPASKGAEMETATTTSNAVGTKKGKILLMDDEELVRNVAKEMVTALGHDVVCAEDGKKAIELFQQAKEAGTPFDLVILDLTVKGGMGGEEAITKIRNIDPDVKAVVSSGYADSPVLADYHAYGFSAILSKPYRIDALQNCLNLFVP